MYRECRKKVSRDYQILNIATTVRVIIIDTQLTDPVTCAMNHKSSIIEAWEKDEWIR